MGSIYDEEYLQQLADDEDEMSEAAILAMISVVTSSQSELEKELRLFYQKHGTDGVITYSEARKWVNERDHRRRLTLLALLLSDTFSKVFSDVRPIFQSLTDNIIKQEFDYFGVAPDPPSLRWGSDNSDWFNRLSDNVIAWESKIMLDIKRGMLTEKNIDEMLKTLDKRFMSIENILQRLVVTETTAISSIARKAAFKELGIGKYKFYAQVDERTCEQCGALHGLIFPISAYEVGVTAPAIHTNCRCYTLPIRD